MREESCPFCAIARGSDQTVEIVCQSERWVAFFPLEPATPGHTLIIPRVHVSDFWEADEALAEELAVAAQRVGKAVGIGLDPEGLNLITSAGAAAEQTVFHLHLHVVPRWTRDGFGAIWPVEGKTYSDERLQDVADRVREACLRVGDTWLS
jgi:histidine triad (HIT) family protein